jgi:hypothetical protein
MIAKIEMIVIVITGLMGAYFQFRYYWRTRRLNSWRWVKLLFSVVSLLWSVVFIEILIANRYVNPPIWHQSIILPLVMITIVTIMGSAVMRIRTEREG